MDVSEHIRMEFATVARPEEPEIAAHQCCECEDVRKRLSPHAFDSVPDATIDWLSDSLPLLSPKGLHYYLPAYLLRVLRNPECNGIDYLLYHLAPSEEDLSDRAQYWEERLSVFSPGQRGAVLAFVSWFATTNVGKEFPDEVSRAQTIWVGAA
jgi:uncharacterized protein DUF6714